MLALAMRELEKVEEEDGVVVGEEGEVDVETLQGEDHVWKEVEEVDLVERWQHFEINTFQHLGKDKL